VNLYNPPRGRIRWLLVSWVFSSFVLGYALFQSPGGRLVWHLIARDRPEEHPWVKPAEAEHIRSGMPPQAPPAGGATLPWRVILSSRDVWRSR
jgi:hypothetical protein